MGNAVDVPAAGVKDRQARVRPARLFSERSLRAPGLRGDGRPLRRVDPAQPVGAAVAVKGPGGHRDVKPSNLLIEHMPDGMEHAFLSDFGLSRATSSDSGLTATVGFIGTPDYCAPEQVRCSRVDGRADQYALACIAFKLLTGKVPFPRPALYDTLKAHVESPVPAVTAHSRGVPAAIDAVIARGMAKRPDDRYRTCRDFATALQKALRQPDRPPRSRGKYIAGLLVGTPLLAAIIVAATDGAAGTNLVKLTTPDGVSNGVFSTASAFSPDGRLLASSGGYDGDIYLWHAATGNYVKTLTMDGGGPLILCGLAFSADDKTLTAAGCDGGTFQWDLATGRGTVLHFSPVNASGVSAVLSGDGSTMATSDEAGTGVDVWNVSTGRRIAELTGPAAAPLLGVTDFSNITGTPVISLDFHARRMTVGDNKGNLYVWNVSTKQIIATLNYDPTAAVNKNAGAAQISPDGKTVFIPADETLRDVATQANITPFDTRWPPTPDLLFSSNNRIIATESGFEADLWNVATRAHIATIGYGSDFIPDLYAVSPDGKELLIADSSGSPYMCRFP